MISQSFRSLEARIPGMRKMWGTSIAADTVYVAHAVAQDHLPEQPFEHMGNLCAGVYTGMLLGYAITIKYEDRPLMQHPGRVRTIAAAGSLAIGLVANSIMETRMGSFANVPDTADFAYGVIASAIAGAMGPTMPKNEQQV